MATVALDQIAFDAGTQVRAAINEDVVAQYAERMNAGDVFPAVIVFHDGNRYYLGDGFHRALAAKRNGLTEIPADVRGGTKTDALWFALGANKANGQRLTDADKRAAVLVAVRTFMNDKSQRQIADQIGCSQGFVSQVITRNNVARPERVPGADGHTYPATKDARASIRDRAAEMLATGSTIDEVRKVVGVGRETAYQIQRQIGVATSVDKSRDAIAQRRKDVRDMAERGFTTRQIASAIGVTTETVGIIAKKEGIYIHADRAVGSTKHHDANRIVEQMVMDAENLTADVNLIDFSELDPSKLAAWLESLAQSRTALNSFIRKLTEEQKKYGEAA